RRPARGLRACLRRRDWPLRAATFPAGGRAACSPGGRHVTITMAQALNQALKDEMEANHRVLVFGEDVGTLGGVFRVTDGIQAAFGEKRCFDTPLAGSGIIGTAIGLAMYGWRPVAEIQFDGFSYPAF